MEFWWIPVLGTIGTFAFLIILVVSTARTKQKKAELQAQIQTKLVERFESAPELIDFLKSQTGQEFISGVRMTQTGAVHRKLIGSMRAAIFLGVLGFGFLILWPLANEQGFIYPGILLLFLGAGFFLSSWFSLKMSRQLGLDRVDDTQPSGGDVR